MFSMFSGSERKFSILPGAKIALYMKSQSIAMSYVLFRDTQQIGCTHAPLL